MKNAIKTYFRPGFLFCTAILGSAVLGMSFVISYLDVQMIKEAIPLKKPLDDLDEGSLGAYKVISKTEIKNLDVLESLGTEDYIQWTLEDTEAGRLSGTKYCSLFITYYTGNPDQVPHVPEECYFGGGHQSFGTGDMVFDLAGGNLADNLKVPLRWILFSNRSNNIWQSSEKFLVFYFFKVNGEYAGNRNSARVVLGKNMFGKYSYFSKVEWRFYDSVSGQMLSPDKEEAIEASKKLLSVILPTLERDHWPEWTITEDQLQNN